MILSQDLPKNSRSYKIFSYKISYTTGMILKGKILARFGTKILLKKSKFSYQDNIRFDLEKSYKNFIKNLIRSCMDKIQARKSPRFL